jgi:uncharacterized protein YndB with AHSA1/START domain
MNEELDPILIQVTIPLPIGMVHGAFTDPGRLSHWLSDAADVSAEVGGRFRLQWKGEPSFESSGTVTVLTPGQDIGFTWFAPPEFGGLMNGPPPKTSVYVRLQESPEGIDVTLEHSGWGSGSAWEDARSWHFQFWDAHLQRLKEYLLKEAYG